MGVEFEERLNKAQKAENVFDRYCEEKNIIFAKSGYEDYISKNGDIFRKNIRSINSSTARRMRYFPDRIVTTKDVTLIEIKNSKTIEKEAYDNYIGLLELGYNVGIIFLKGNGKLLYCKISDLRLEDVYSKNVPVLENKWFAPRELPERDYYLWKSKHPNASGTTFGIVDFDNTPFVELIKENNVEKKRVLP